MSSAAAIAFAGIRAQDQSNALPGRGSCGESDNGIVRSGEAITFTYDYESRVTLITKPGMTTNTFSYNGLDTRVGVSDSLGSRNFKRNGIGVTAPVLSDGLANYTPSGEVRGGLKTTFHSALKNADIQTNSSGAVSASAQFDAFGNPLSGSGTWKSPFGYAGQFGYQQDVDTGLKLLGHRYYDSDTGRFLTRDRVKDSENWYGYCDNNSLTCFDANGLWKITIFDLECSGAVIANGVATGSHAAASGMTFGLYRGHGYETEPGYAVSKGLGNVAGGSFALAALVHVWVAVVPSAKLVAAGSGASVGAIGNDRAAVIGNNMQRVTIAADVFKLELFKPTSTDRLTDWVQNLTWIFKQVYSKPYIVDIGPVPGQRPY